VGQAGLNDVEVRRTALPQAADSLFRRSSLKEWGRSTPSLWLIFLWLIFRLLVGALR
jgi:hypothetical protein